MKTTKHTLLAALSMAFFGLWPIRFGHAQATTAAPQVAPDPGYVQARTRDADGLVTGPARAGWWNDAVFYQVFLRSFKDSAAGPLAGDGIGDIPGLIEKLDYLNDGKGGGLGVTALWIMPMSPSPSYHGYDVTDYTGVNAQYGTPDDFRRLTGECHKRGIKVILDLVLNHCSDEHPWFVEAKDPKSPKHDWFIWADNDPKWKGPWGQTVWHPASERAMSGPYYYGLFSHRMPDLNYRNDEVSRQMLDIVGFWVRDRAGGDAAAKSMGADGYRLDAIRHLIEDGQKQENTPETHAWLKEFRAALKAANPGAFSIGEVWTDSAVASSYVGDQLDAVFEFDLSFAMVDAAKTGKAARVREAQERVLKLYPPNQYGRFLTNHDQPRVMTELKGDEGAMRVAAAMLLTGPGIPFIYYGEELGMTGPKPDEKIRTPMQWSPEDAAGFTTGKPWQLPNRGYKKLNVEKELSDADSLLSLYRRLVNLRNTTPALRLGSYRPVTCDNPGVYAFVREFGMQEGHEAQTVLVVINLADKPAKSTALSIPFTALRGACTPRDLLHPDAAPAAPKLNPQGGFEDYAPFKKLDAQSASVILLSPTP